MRIKLPLSTLRKRCDFAKNTYLCGWVSLVRPAPLETPQGRKDARIQGRSGALQVAYPFFVPITHVPARHSSHPLPTCCAPYDAAPGSTHAGHPSLLPVPSAIQILRATADHQLASATCKASPSLAHNKRLRHDVAKAPTAPRCYRRQRAAVGVHPPALGMSPAKP